MAKKKKVTTTTEEEIPETPAPLPEPPPVFEEVPDDELPPDLGTVLAELGEDVTRVVLYRRAGNQPQKYVGSLDASECTLDEIARRFGGGKYLARFASTRGFLGARTFYIDESIKPAASGSPVEVGTYTPLQMMERMVDKLADRLDRIQAAPQKDPVELAVSLIGALAPVFAKTAGGGGSDPLEAIRLGVELAEGRAPSDGGYLPVIREIGVPLVRALDRMSGVRPNPAPAALPKPTTPAPPVATPGEGKSVAVPQWIATIHPFLPTILRYAEMKADPELVAAAVELQSPTLAQWIDQQVSDGVALVPELLHHVPTLTPHRDWLEAVLACFGPDDPESPEPPEVPPVPETPIN